MARVWADVYNRRDLDALVDLYEPACVFAARSGPLRGREAVRSYFAAALSAKTRIEHHTRKLIDHGEIALCYLQWLFIPQRTMGHKARARAEAIEILHRQPDGIWLDWVDDPNTDDRSEE